ncbi:hypothetical protein [Microbulbifer yueqingensis]|uniref:hypothetical protein n=1 Tax=Microbulbifer yueqingensis TaxID=658219 RepID=UPI000B853A1B|nr:hypothetical protein [Microbulbifer yueqingensis]
MFSNFLHASCELLEYEKYLNTQSVVMMESALALAEDDKESFLTVRPFVKYQVRRNKLSAYVARELSTLDPALLNLDGNVAKLLPSFQLKVDAEGQLEDKVDNAMADNAYYIAERRALAPAEGRYLFNRGMSDMERSRFWTARKLLNDYMTDHHMFPSLKSTSSTAFASICN